MLKNKYPLPFEGGVGGGFKSWYNRAQVKKRKTLLVTCACGQKLAKYAKGGKGRLVKMFLERIKEDQQQLFLTSPPQKLHENIVCPSCHKRVATIQIINGRYAAKLNQGAISS